ncbi:hypothetical protein [Corynebacterium diphtheriae]|uniref:hypothetical protein n=1 Tax=Corynebacterium diphtheriae TaxID=1717 RepID=UPI00026018E9|nr:hypothetical protein [Corynebacterium diphtheriae]EIK57193.1 immunity-specific protein Beta286 [Corynebacterium diphtheriae bv. intermedius str. NCTC 5011]OFI53871.1 hypothetical protein BKD83_01525 [Corynebacterium diphtheriae]OKY20823.1 hypothetical protein AO271_05480 [Corynebacterium diphtheriae]OSQ21418.1 hypothetical protein B1A52_04460 [Corynebacterium diphtheriae]OWM37420.1 hypothetical protein AZF05_04550 [Corynebacterium diphtheriae bv. intermedius]
MDLSQWEQFAKHRSAVIRDYGMWIGLMDNSMEPIVDMPAPVSIDAPITRMTPSSCKAVFKTRVDGHIHPMVDYLIAENLAKVDEQGQLIAAAQDAVFLAIEVAQGIRNVYKGVFTVALGDQESPTLLEFNGVCEIQWTLGALPCPSAPYSWTGKWVDLNQDWAGKWSKTRTMADIKVAEVADGFTLSGAADTTIGKLISQSLQAINTMLKSKGRSLPIAVKPVTSNPTSPQLVIRPTDRFIWDEISDLALAAGVTVKCKTWWPSDPPVPGLDLKEPIVVIEITQEE